ncbi:IDEAL domain-containing protein [Bacillus cereus]|uniref:IDEAL domain-containing protein n=2 Tax=Bacillus cereus group TaxID=86661 RepID=A0A2C2FE41_BACCE|nr:MULTISPECIES: IDEAL domain-containing protein [Bacillus cereus group]ALQ68978.1 group-specific protein [Bacillus thuringiensis]OUA10267.1 group-specific protein [Bacillus thuringiensis serovar finitimus]PEC82892.1 IDEAL domain-containing protein [Bacillus cereus]PEQ50282.1 IDEAL domain-containing protein [Bacillus cereus]PEX32296.1 IDEAL domain-containing protein [Bacillus cereus]
MMSNNNHILKVGDWVRGISNEGELIVGYIASLDDVEDVVTVIIVKRDNKYTMNEAISLYSKHVNKLPESKAVNKEQILYLIDLALLTGDEEWFIELSSKLNSIKELVNEGF